MTDIDLELDRLLNEAEETLKKRKHIKIKDSFNEPIWESQTKVCTGCGTKFKGKQKYYLGYEGNFLHEEMYWCPFCYKNNLKEFFLFSKNFDLEEVSEGTEQIKKYNSIENFFKAYPKFL